MSSYNEINNEINNNLKWKRVKTNIIKFKFGMFSEFYYSTTIKTNFISLGL